MMVLATQKIAIGDNSYLERVGLKGPNAETWLASQGLTLPELPNSWVVTAVGSLVLRLGNSEFLIEDQADQGIVKSLKAQMKSPVQGIYPVARADAAFTLSGDALPALFSEICLLDLQTETNNHRLLMTQLASISATVLQQQQDNQALYRIWCDGTYHRYMKSILTVIARDIGDL